MNTPDLEQDLNFLRDTLERSKPPAGTRSIYLFWAIAMLIGMPLGDFRPTWMPDFWMIVGPGGWIVSAILGRRAAAQSGQSDRAFSYRQGAHWGAMVIVIGLITILPYRGIMPWEAMGPMVLLVLSFTYCLAAIHFGRILFAPSLMFAIGFAIMLASPPYPWTIVGILGAIGLGFSAFADENSHDDVKQ